MSIDAKSSHDLHTQGHVLLRQVISPQHLPALRQAFDDNVLAARLWPTPREVGWRFSRVDLDEHIQAACRLPALIGAVGQLIGEPFFLSQIDGREPLPGHGHQRLHRDMHLQRPGDTAHVMVFLDDYGPFNGATRLVPASHRPAAGAPALDELDESNTAFISGQAGDMLVFDSDLVHGASCNVSGMRRRSLLLAFFAESLREAHAATAHWRGVRMDTSECFIPQEMTLRGETP